MAAVDAERGRSLARALAWTRIALGALLVAAPAVADPFLGPAEARRAGSRVLARGLGARDLALGTGVLLALRHDAPVRGWVEAGGLADAGDAVGILLGFSRLPRTLRWVMLAASAGAVATARMVAPGVDRA
jgi:hypothetical protein